MDRIRNRLSKTINQPPGTLIHVGEHTKEKVKISIVTYDEKHFQKKEVKTIEECYSYVKQSTITWINIDGLHDLKIIEKLGKQFNIHPIVLEDIVNTQQRPKMENFDKYDFIVLKDASYEDKFKKLKIEQVSIILGANFVISFQEKEGDIFNPVIERIQSSKGYIRKMGVDYLAYTLIDTIVDNYFVALEEFGDKLDSLEEELLSDMDGEITHRIHRLKIELIVLHKSILPLRELIIRLERNESRFMKESTLMYLRDLYDHTIHIIETIEISRDIISEMFDTNLSIINNKMNSIMKVLTLIATIFIPLTFLTGIYGMNFRYMPELKWHWGYLSVWAAAIVISVSMLFFFKRKKWF